MGFAGIGCGEGWGAGRGVKDEAEDFGLSKRKNRDAIG